MEYSELSHEDWLILEEQNLISLAREKLSQGQYFGMHLSEIEQDLHRISRAFFLADEWHKWESRDNGDPYITHPIAVAKILLEEFTHTTTKQIIGALLHDVKESKTISLERIAQEFDTGIAKNVDALSKKELEEYIAPHESPFYHTQTMMEAALTSWIRILNPYQEVNIQSFATTYFGERLRQRRDKDTFWNLDRLDDDELAEKLADRIHNLRTLCYCSVEKRRKIILETKKYFLPVAQDRFPDDGYILLTKEIDRLERSEVQGKIVKILELSE